MAVLGLVYVVTAVLTNVISNNASVVLMVPVAAEAAPARRQRLRVRPRGDLRSVDRVRDARRLPDQPVRHGPGGYRFSDFTRAGGPLQALLAVVTTVGIAYFWGLTPA